MLAQVGSSFIIVPFYLHFIEILYLVHNIFDYTIALSHHQKAITIPPKIAPPQNDRLCCSSKSDRLLRSYPKQWQF
ncbi:hypothetical protein [Microcystis sp. M061S2]|uniref:hypothetical protein n=1 Tax=Microcystis sp. M061S2 TaxID=2771171 RepID=UPI00258CD8DA|nr:hypothetical protein [Microcystis sp. M061S2]MCA2655090.1 hypothetical protein [Microcystis sp. M061S2]